MYQLKVQMSLFYFVTIMSKEKDEKQEQIKKLNEVKQKVTNPELAKSIDEKLKYVNKPINK